MLYMGDLVMNRLKLFLENFLVYGLGGMISKIIPLIMLPIITRLMPNTFYFGLNDMSTVAVSFASAIALMGMYDAMYRLFFEYSEKEKKQEICSTTLLFTLFTSTIIFMILIIFKTFFANLFFGSEKYFNLLFLTAASVLIGSTNSIVSAPTRMENKRGMFLILNTISPLLSYSIAIPLLLNGNYVIAVPLAALVSSVISEIIFLVYNRKWFSLTKVNFAYLKDLLKIGIPLFPNFLIYWIFNSCDRLFISKMLGMQQVGIYSIGSKLGQVSQLIYIAFAGGWQYFSFSTMNDNDQVEMTSNIFEYLGIITFFVTMLMCAFNQTIFNVIFTSEYVKGAIVAPYLFMSPLVQMLYQVTVNQFLIIKKTWPTTLILAIGAILNLLLNFIGIPLFGIEGAALATLIGYTSSTIICVIVLKKLDLINIKKRFGYACALFICFFISWRFIFQTSLVLSIALCFIFSTIIAYLYKKDILKVSSKLMNKIGGN